MDESEIYSILSKGKKNKKFQVEFGKAGRDISHQTKKEIEALKLPGITFKRDSKRFYPNGIFASHLVGYADRIDQKDGSYNYVGKMGIEQLLNDELTGKNGKLNSKAIYGGICFLMERKKFPLHRMVMMSI